jgi:hypothetical protein
MSRTSQSGSQQDYEDDEAEAARHARETPALHRMRLLAQIEAAQQALTALDVEHPPERPATRRTRQRRGASKPPLPDESYGVTR